MPIRNFICTICFTIFALSASAQSINILILNEQKQPLPYASVRMTELKKVVLTDTSGIVKLENIPSGTYAIEISQMGFQPVKSKVRTGQSYTFTLTTNTTILASVAVFGFSPTQQINKLSYNVAAIDAQKLRNTTLDIAHVLDRVPGARLRESGGVGADFDFSISGFSGNRVKFFLDGIPMDNFGSSFQINNIPINFAERVEVYKGVVPIWLGSDALGGAVNIVTGNDRQNYLDVSYSYGSFNTHRSNINTAFTSKKGFTVQLNAFQNYADNNYTVTVDAANIRTGRYYPNTKVKRFHDQYHNETVIAQTGFVNKSWADKFLIGITLGQNYKQIQSGARMEAVFGAWHTRGNIVMPTLKYQKKDLFIKGLSATLNANYNFGKEQNIDTVHARYGWLGDSIHLTGNGGERNYQYYKYSNNSANASATFTYDINTKHHFALNHVFSYFNRKGRDLVLPADQQYQVPQKTNKDISGISYQYAPNDKWNTTLFGKYLHQHSVSTLLTSNAGSLPDTIPVQASRNKFGYGIATSYFIQPALQVKLSYEHTNRMPDNEDIFGDLINREANWDVKPEYSDNFNLGLQYSLRLTEQHRLRIATTGVYYHAKDFIYYTVNTNNKLVAQNLEGVANLGIETEVRYSYKQFITAGASMTYQNLQNRQKYVDILGNRILNDLYKERIPNIPYLFGNADASIFFNHVFTTSDKLTVGYNLLYVHDFYLYWASEGSVDSKRIIPEQLSHDANIVYALANGKYNIALECKNLSNNQLYDNFSLQKPGRAFYLKLRYFISHK